MGQSKSDKENPSYRESARGLAGLHLLRPSPAEGGTKQPTSEPPRCGGQRLSRSADVRASDDVIAFGKRLDTVRMINVRPYTTTQTHSTFVVRDGAVFGGSPNAGHPHNTIVVLSGGTIECTPPFELGDHNTIYVEQGGVLDLPSCKSSSFNNIYHEGGFKHVVKAGVGLGTHHSTTWWQSPKTKDDFGTLVECPESKGIAFTVDDDLYSIPDIGIGGNGNGNGYGYGNDNGYGNGNGNGGSTTGEGDEGGGSDDDDRYNQDDYFVDSSTSSTSSFVDCRLVDQRECTLVRLSRTPPLEYSPPPPLH